MDGYDWCIKLSRMPGVFSGLKVQKSLFKLKKLRRSNFTWPITSTGLNVTFPLLLLTVAWMHGKEAVDFFLPLKASFCHKWKKAEIRTRFIYFPPIPPAPPHQIWNCFRNNASKCQNNSGELSSVTSQRKAPFPTGLNLKLRKIKYLELYNKNLKNMY